MTAEELARRMAEATRGPSVVAYGPAHPKVAALLPYAEALITMRDALEAWDAWDRTGEAVRLSASFALAKLDALLEEPNERA